MAELKVKHLTDIIYENAYPLTGNSSNYTPLLDMIGNARVVLMGEATHGTDEFYRERAEITKRLITEKGFNAIAVEADWPDAYRINHYILGKTDITNAEDSLAGFQRFPTWMWRNKVMVEFINWLRLYNDSQHIELLKTGFYGLDLYSLSASVEAVITYLDQVDPDAARRARNRYSCFDDFKNNIQAYGYASEFGLTRSCEDAIIEQLTELRYNAFSYMQHDGFMGGDEFFYAEQNARLVKNAEKYYRAMFRSQVSSWNLRDRHMAETLRVLITHLGNKLNKQAKVVVWAHNSHVGDARATEAASRNELNIGQLVREKYGNEAVLIGFSTYSGTVTAASDWEAPAERKYLRPALPGSYESLFHHVSIPNFMLLLQENPTVSKSLGRDTLQRAVGVVYRPDTERMSHYYHTKLSQQFDAVIHLDKTHAVEPLEATAKWHKGEVFETFPSGL